MSKVLDFSRPEDAPPSEAELPQKVPDVADLIALCENLDQGMKLMINVIAQLEKRVHDLELAERKRSRIMRPVIVNDLKVR